MAHLARSPSAAPPGEPDTTELIRVLSEHFGVELGPREFTLADGTRVGGDRADGDVPTVPAQCSPLRGQVKSARRNIIADAFELAWLRDAHFPDARAVLALGSPHERLLGRGAWLSAAPAAHRIAVVLMDGRGGIHTVETGT